MYPTPLIKKKKSLCNRQKPLRKPQPFKIQETNGHGVPSLNWHAHSTTPAPKARRSQKRKGDWETRDQEVMSQIMPPRNVREATPLKSHQHGCLNKTWAKVTRVGEWACWRGREDAYLNSRQRAMGNWRKLRAGELVSPGTEHPSWWCNSKCHHEYISNIIRDKQVLFMYLEKSIKQ